MENNVTIMTIPPGLISKTQPVDVSWNKPYQVKMREQWNKKLVTKNSPTFKAANKLM